MTGPTFAPTALAPAPRPAAPPRVPARVTPALKAGAEEPASALRVLTYLRLHWMMILFCGGLLGAGLAYAAWSLMPVKYESTAQLLVTQNQAGLSGGDANKGQADFQTYMRTQKALIRSEIVLRHAMNNTAYKITDLPTLRGKDDPQVLSWLREKVIIDDTAQLLSITLEGDRPDDIPKIVDAVKDAYLAIEVVEKDKLDPECQLRVQVEKAMAGGRGV